MDNEDVNKKLVALNGEIELVRFEIAKLQKKLTILQNKRDELEKQTTLKKSFDKESGNKYAGTNFDWSAAVQTILKDKFKLNTFRPTQLKAINATLSKKDLLLLMPTGGGKSLCYQLPALVGNGITLVISPLISLIEDQIIALSKFGIVGKSVNSSTSKKERQIIYDYMKNKTGPTIKLVFVTPEWFSKSKIFKSYLQKCYALKNLDRIAIDEVHCCSQWGHDFRPDYKFLSFLKNMFFDIPIIGLTATATLSVLLDVQNMLNLKGCLIFRSTFDRPNLFYKIKNKPAKKEDALEYIANLLTNKFKNESGIIYALSIKDTEELSEDLRKRGIRVRPYHALLETELRSQVHEKWLKNEYQVVVATVAFGMGIDKPDVRFVIHYNIPKSVENLYQESGRAGRDGLPAYCILMYRFSDYFRNSAIINSKTEESNLLSVLEYCLDTQTCRRKLLAAHFDDKNESTNTCSMCDNCTSSPEMVTYNVAVICDVLYKIIENAEKREVHLTLLKLMDAWYKNGDKNLRAETVKRPSIEKNELETIIARLLLRGFLTDYKIYTSYATNCYIQKGRNTKFNEHTVIDMTFSSNIKFKDLPKRKTDDIILIDDSPKRKKIT